ncbi:MAG: ammonium transporter, Amt family [Acidimicrobiaceae bacterium]|jgi:Amt family ammonium transporter|nr:ammonium transporter, Amt family [Acidimicrobiaceae bacterium]MDQ1366712.1 ammonium transporter, Amt family [Acidimicrobiaceae bacterium]MDQ1378070.1 ammonium transporter, Amt family [Acidimicrobiaceae bacterium]MDQ1414793.1 ammonium transporter, Amt family [Acidimicrobiaceae bacterium]MDQ1419061.1 ammonium transporter, Amt family [Acidimicrobiaceae bacterium]
MIRSRLQRFKQKDTRKLIATIMAGKMIGLMSIFGIMKGVSWYFESSAHAAPLVRQAAVNTDQLVSSANTVWVLVTAFLVFFMQAGFMGLEAGFARSRETVNVLLECVFDTCLCGLLYWAIGFAFQFGSGNGLIGHEYFFLHGMTPAYKTSSVAFLAFFLFQFAFADTASTVTSGAMVGRTGFKGDIIYSTLVSGFFYPIFGHWVWGPGGWLGNTMGWFHGLAGGTVFRDFAGSTVVHTVGGFIALAGCIVLGPRLGRVFKRDGGGPLAPHDLTWGAIGGVILWFGWYGFNPGSTLSAMDWVGIGRVAANTTLAACGGGMMAVLFVYRKTKIWDLSISVNGFLGGLVAITCPCYWVSPFGAIVIGAVAGIVVPLGMDFMEWRRWDDPIGAVAVHGFAGIWGTLSLGLLATGQYGIPTPTGTDTSTVVTGLFYGGGTAQLRSQFIGSMTCVVVVGGLALLVMKLIKMIPGSWTLRVSRDGELEGLDLHEHGTAAYHVEFGQGMTYSAPPNLSPRNGAKEPVVTQVETIDPESSPVGPESSPV